MAIKLSLPIPSADLVRRKEAHAYPTDFSAIPNVWINRLSLRGEELTLCLVRAYVPDLVADPESRSDQLFASASSRA